MIRYAVAIVMATGALAASAQAQSGLSPYQMVRSLQLVQDRLAAGDHAALPMQRKLLEMIDRRLRDAGPELLAEGRNVSGLLVYAMSGGNPATVELVLSRLSSDAPGRAAGYAVLDYLRGRPGPAARSFAGIDPRTAAPELQPSLALVKGGIVALENPAAALELLDFARLTAPGSLVEEAALRRSISIAEALGDLDRFLRHSEQYVRRFLRSPYAAQFAETFVAGIVAFADRVSFDQIETIVSGMTPEQQKVIYLRIARYGAVEARNDLSDRASQRAREIEDAGVATDDPRAVLYSSISSVTSETVDDVLAKLKSIDPAQLSPGDRRLLDAAMGVAETVLSPVVAAPAGTPPAAVAVRDPDAPSPPDSALSGPASPEPRPYAPPASETVAPSAQEDAQPVEIAEPAPDPVDESIEKTRESIAKIDALLKDSVE